MELRTLRYFLALAQEGTVSNAAKALHVTQPTLSRQLADLERGFGKQLFERGAKRIVSARRGSFLDEAALKRLRIALKRARHFITCGGRYLGLGTPDPLIIRQALIHDARQSSYNAKRAGEDRQLRLF